MTVVHPLSPCFWKAIFRMILSLGYGASFSNCYYWTKIKITSGFCTVVQASPGFLKMIPEVIVTTSRGQTADWPVSDWPTKSPYFCYNQISQTAQATAFRLCLECYCQIKKLIEMEDIKDLIRIVIEFTKRNIPLIDIKAQDGNGNKELNLFLGLKDGLYETDMEASKGIYGTDGQHQNRGNTARR